jgi:transcriptional regulator with XRE-family HTH domain
MRKIMNLQQLRLDRGWSQEHLADLSGVSARTIQRIENGSNAGLDTLNSLAAAFDIDVAALTAAPGVETVELGDGIVAAPNDAALQHKLIRRQVRRQREFYVHLASFGLIIPFLLVLNIMLSPQYYWVIWPFLGWGAATVLHWIIVFPMRGFMDEDWEEKQINQHFDRAG